MVVPRSTVQRTTLYRFSTYVLRYKVRLFYAIGCSFLITVFTLLLLSLIKPTAEALFDERAGETVSEARAADTGAGVDEPSLEHLYQDKIRWLISPVYRLIEQLSRDDPFVKLTIICGCILLLVIVNGIFRYIQEYMVNWIGNRTVLDIQRDLFDRMIQFNSAYFARNKVGFLISYFTVDTRVIGNTVFHVFGRLLLDPLLIVGSIAFLFYIQWKLTLLYAIVFPFIVLSIQYFARRSRRASRRAQEITANLGALLQEHFSFIRLVQGYGMYKRQQDLFRRETRGVFDSMMSMAKTMAASSPINEFLGVFALCCVLLLGGLMIFRYSSDMTGFEASDFLVFVGLLSYIYQPVKRMERTIQQVQQGLAAAERVFSILDADEIVPESSQPIAVRDFTRQIEFDQVTFSYDGLVEVLHEISFTVQKGEQVALVGPSGAGKTTLVNLIPRFYDPTSGRIALDGHDLRSLKIDDLRKLISYVHQDVMILADTVKANITCGDPSYSDEAVVRAATMASAHEFIMELPKGYDTVVGERGETLSGGQCQRIAMARAFLRDTPILILDEATSSLDSESEQRIKQSLQTLMQGRTSFVIAHRLSTILQSDTIVVLDRGHIVDIGPHADLVKRCSLYQRLYRLQFSDDSLPADKPVEIRN